MQKSQRLFAVIVLVSAFFASVVSYAQVIVTNDPPSFGPYNANFLPDGTGLVKPIQPKDTVLRPDLPWSLYGWVKAAEVPQALSLIAGVGDPNDASPRFIALENGRLELWMGKDNVLATQAAISVGRWHFIAASFDGNEFRLYADGAQAGSGKLLLAAVSPVLQLAPARPAWPPQPGERVIPSWQHFGGKMAGLTLVRSALSPEDVKQMSSQPPDFALTVYEEGSKPWPAQTRQQLGYRAPQDPSTMPKSKAPFSKPVARPLPKVGPALEETDNNQWMIARGWKLIPVPDESADIDAISERSFDDTKWWPATVPGTALTTMIDRGVYPDPDYGLNNIAIPESLNKQDYWYRNEFRAPKVEAGRRLTLTFEGINYRALVWLNGQSLGSITGAFIRGIFDVTGLVKPGQNVLVVRVSPPPHPGIPQEQSMKGGPGENGGYMTIDGPTFVATEGWDWVPAIRDRDTGIWQPVTLTATGNVKIGDPQVVTSLPLPDFSRADVEITVPLENHSASIERGTVTASFEGVTVTKEASVPPGESSVTLTPSEFAQLRVHNPRLWWPNGYGKPELYHLKLTFTQSGKTSDIRESRFGIREISYELSLFDSTGHLRRVEYSPTAARGTKEAIVNIRHSGMREIPPYDPPPSDWPVERRPEWKSWAASLTRAGESSPAIRPVIDARMNSNLVIKVNGVRIAARGGNWGMDDSRKRVSRERLEPYFRLYRDANLNIIRNWVGQSTEKVFYDLADEYGQLVWNDFWDSTQNYNAEVEDPALFLKNARDTILRFRNHPSIVLWCGRNEGVPQPIVNEGLDELVRTLDGTRQYWPTSNQVNLAGSGPYKYQNPELYYTTHNHGFSVETGTPSFSTLESFQAWVPKEDQWPISDAWAYHDWHQSAGGDMTPFTAEMETEFGAATSLEDFERKAQMLNYVSHRAIFEGMNAHLFAPNSGRLLWMTQPAWPSNTWQILNSDYDTQASFYGVKKACEPIHVQLDLSDYSVDVVNTTASAVPGLTVSARVFSLDNKLLLDREQRVDSVANAAVNALALDLDSLLAKAMAIVRLELRDSGGKLLSENLYWLGDDSLSYRELARLPMTTLTATAGASRSGDVGHLHVRLNNAGSTVALMNKLTLMNADDATRILPAYFSDNYVSLLPGESRDIEIEYPASAAHSNIQVKLRGWNVTPTTIAVGQK